MDWHITVLTKGCITDYLHWFTHDSMLLCQQPSSRMGSSSVLPCQGRHT